MHTIEEIAALLHIQEKAHANGNLPNVAASALNRLRKINEEMGVHGFGSEPAPPEEPPAQLEAKEETEGEEEPTHA